MLKPGADPAVAGLIRFIFQALLWWLFLAAGLAQVLAEQVEQRLADQAGFARAGNPRDRTEAAQREGHLELVKVVAADAFQLQPCLSLARLARRRQVVVEQVMAGARGIDLRQAGRRAAVQHLAAVFTGIRADVHQPVGAAHGVQVVLDHVHRVARLLEPLQGLEQRLAVGWMQPGRRLIEHVDHPEQLRVELGRQAQALQFARGQRRRAAFQVQVTEAQVDQGGDALQQLLGDALRGQAFFHRQVGRVAHVRAACVGVVAPSSALLARLAGLRMAEHRAGFVRLIQVVGSGHGLEQLGQGQQRQARQLGDVLAGKGHCQRLGFQALAGAGRAGAGAHEGRDAFAHQRALRMGEGVQHVASGAAEGALVTGFELALERLAGLRRRHSRVHRHGRGFFSEQNPVALFLGQLAPGDVDVIAQGHEDVAQVLPLPGHGPGGHRPFADGQRRVGHHRRLADIEHPAQAMTLRAGALRGIGRKIFGEQHRLLGRVTAGTRIEHADQARQGGDTADR
ncbi:hypothetical protein D3C79_505530 [compost metagenome]